MTAIDGRRSVIASVARRSPIGGSSQPVGASDQQQGDQDRARRGPAGGAGSIAFAVDGDGPAAGADAARRADGSRCDRPNRGDEGDNRTPRHGCDQRCRASRIAEPSRSRAMELFSRGRGRRRHLQARSSGAFVRVTTCPARSSSIRQDLVGLLRRRMRTPFLRKSCASVSTASTPKRRPCDCPIDEFTPTTAWPRGKTDTVAESR